MLDDVSTMTAQPSLCPEDLGTSGPYVGASSNLSLPYAPTAAPRWGNPDASFHSTSELLPTEVQRVTCPSRAYLSPMSHNSNTLVSVWTDYDNGKVGIQLAGMPKTTVTPEKARTIADRIEKEEAPKYADDPQYEIEGFVDDIREAAEMAEKCQ